MTLVPCLRCTTPCPPLLESCPCCGMALAVPNSGAVRPSVALLVGLSLTSACDDLKSQPDYGVAITDTGYIDNDGDGYAEVDGDCDDDNAEVNPEAEETPGDGIDSNCDGSDDT